MNFYAREKKLRIILWIVLFLGVIGFIVSFPYLTYLYFTKVISTATLWISSITMVIILLSIEDKINILNEEIGDI